MLEDDCRESQRVERKGGMSGEERIELERKRVVEILAGRTYRSIADLKIEQRMMGLLHGVG